MKAIKNRTIHLVAVIILLIAGVNALSSCMECSDPQQIERNLRCISQIIDKETESGQEPANYKVNNKRIRRKHSRNRRSNGKRDGQYIIVFYAWGSGQELPVGKSPFGHAFVDIPTIGPVGYSGQVTNHAEQVRYAMYRCAVPLTKEQLQSAIDKYWEWKRNPPQYDLMKTDCTTFALDIADAANIEYGSRVFIQSPAGFLRELIKHNPQ